MMNIEEIIRNVDEFQMYNWSTEDVYEAGYNEGLEDGIKQENQKMLELIEYINSLLEINKCSDNIYPILSFMCRNGYFENWEFKNDDIFIDGKQITKDGTYYVSEKMS